MGCFGGVGVRDGERADIDGVICCFTAALMMDVWLAVEEWRDSCLDVKSPWAIQAGVDVKFMRFIARL